MDEELKQKKVLSSMGSIKAPLARPGAMTAKPLLTRPATKPMGIKPLGETENRIPSAVPATKSPMARPLMTKPLVKPTKPLGIKPVKPTVKPVAPVAQPAQRLQQNRQRLLAKRKARLAQLAQRKINR